MTDAPNKGAPVAPTACAKEFSQPHPVSSTGAVFEHHQTLASCGPISTNSADSADLLFRNLLGTFDGTGKGVPLNAKPFMVCPEPSFETRGLADAHLNVPPGYKASRSPPRSEFGDWLLKTNMMQPC
jgi:hypothetical protein